MKSNKLIILTGVILTSIALAIAYILAVNNAKRNLHINLQSKLQQVVNELQIRLEKHAYLPTLLSSEQKIIDFVAPFNSKKSVLENTPKQKEMNLVLERNNNISAASVIYIMRLDGTTIASSNWKSKDSFVGQNYSFRPYFKNALQNILGRYYALGIISGKRGYYFSNSINKDNKAIGAVTVKIAIDEIEFTWGKSIDFMVTDSNGVVFLSSQENWNLKTFLPLTALQKENIIKSRQYGTKAIPSLENTLIDINNYGFQKVEILGKQYEMLSKKMEGANWDVRVLTNYSEFKKEVSSNMLISTLVILLLASLVSLSLRIQNQRKRYELHIREELELKVAKRTKALKQSQEDLIQAAKMAALGQLSASITHEINNPLSAIRTYADNAHQFLEKERFEMVESNLGEISKLTESMAAITKQLKAFSRKSKGELIPVSIENAVNNALSIIHPKIINSGVIVHQETLPQNGNYSKRVVLADEIWLGQILVNLLSNAISATKGKEQRDVWIDIHEQFIDKRPFWCIQIKDNGTGIDENTLPHIFEPFFTTKPSAKGLGLGLSISFNLAKDMNGSLKAQNNQEGGASFTLCLPSSSISSH